MTDSPPVSGVVMLSFFSLVWFDKSAVGFCCYCFYFFFRVLFCILLLVDPGCGVLCLCVDNTQKCKTNKQQQKSCALPVKYVGKWIPSLQHMSVDSLMWSALSVTVTMCTGLLLCQQDKIRTGLSLSQGVNTTCTECWLYSAEWLQDSLLSAPFLAPGSKK